VRELLLLLVLHPDGRTKEQIALALWPDASPAQLRNAFHVTMHQLRRALGDKAAVTFDGSAYALARAATPGGADGDAPVAGEAVVVRTDLDALLAAADAARAADGAAERGGARGAGALDALGADAGTLARWRPRARRGAPRAARRGRGRGRVAGAAPGARRRDLGRRHGGAGAAARAAGGAPGGRGVLEALVAAEPLREAAHRALMATYVAAGEPARALAHYDALAAQLARELGAAPGRETRALAEAIRGGGRAPR
jgi:DNA-binding SARP family transcriptional activator